MDLIGLLFPLTLFGVPTVGLILGAILPPFFTEATCFWPSC